MASTQAPRCAVGETPTTGSSGLAMRKKGKGRGATTQTGIFGDIGGPAALHAEYWHGSPPQCCHPSGAKPQIRAHKSVERCAPGCALCTPFAAGRPHFGQEEIAKKPTSFTGSELCFCKASFCRRGTFLPPVPRSREGIRGPRDTPNAPGHQSHHPAALKPRRFLAPLLAMPQK